MHTTASATALTVRNVLLATDFSPCSQRALLHAVAAARHFGSTLHLLHVVNPMPFSITAPEAYLGCVEVANIAANRARTEAEVLLSNVLRSTHCEDVKTNICVEVGMVSGVLRATVNREHADLVVIGTRGRTGLRKIVLGSVAQEIFREASCPVLTVGPYSWQSDPQAVRLKHILFPTNLSESSARALPLAIAMAEEFNAEFTTLNVIEPCGSEMERDRTRLVAASQERMREMIRLAAASPLQADLQVEFGDVAGRVIETAAQLKTDMIIAGLNPPDTHTDNLRWRHAYRVVCDAGCPVLTLRGSMVYS